MKLEDCKSGVWVTRDGAIGSISRVSMTGVIAFLYMLDENGKPWLYGGAQLHDPSVLTQATDQEVEEHIGKVNAYREAEKQRRATEAHQWAERLATVDWSKEDTSTIRSVAVVMGWNTEDDS